MRDPNAVVYLVPGVGMITFARDKATARISGEFYVNAINVMRGASGVSTYVGLPEQEAFDIEYWLLEEAKLQRMPKPKAAGRQGRADHRRRRRHRQGDRRALPARRRLRRLADIDDTALAATDEELAGRHTADVVRSVRLDVTREQDVIDAFAFAAAEYRRPRHPGLQRRHLLVGADRGHRAVDVEPQHGHPLDRLFPGRRARRSG